ncbi:MAG: permease-like cell division protein FtsX [Clostridia bacterium]|nr:permease-like cell division protein FtsX [Clostridia bacterium]
MYFLQTAFKSIRKNYLMTFASIFVLIACMLIIGSAHLCSGNITAFMENLGEKNEIVAYIDDEVPEENLQSLEDEILAVSEYITDVEFITKDEALTEYQKRFGEDGEYLSWFYGDENPLRNEYRIRVDEKHLEEFESISARISAVDGVANISDSQDIVNMLLSLKRVLDILGFWIMLILALVSWFIVSNTIKLAMYSRRHEINIMKYVGATNGFIRTPFILEGVIIGICAAAISFALQWVVYVYLLQPLVQNLNFIETVPFVELCPMILVYFCGIGLFVGLFGSAFSINKYLKV